MRAAVQGLRSKKAGEPQNYAATSGETGRAAPSFTLGLRIVNLDQVDAAIDIVFIHGLTGGRESTWTAKGAAACWPETLLLNDVPKARIILYGYDADVVNFWSMASQNTIGDHSQKFLVSLANLRDSTNSATRPLVFVAHSLGGIVVQDVRPNNSAQEPTKVYQALLKSRSSADQYTQRILEHTKGVIFMGTPHCGSGLAEWAVIGSRFLQYFRKVNQQTLEVLQQRSEVMERIRQDFHTMLRGRDQSREDIMTIVCFFEELPVPVVGRIVPKASATLDRHQGISIRANHMDMTKFTSNQDPDYRNVLSELQRFAKALPQEPNEAPSSASPETSKAGATLCNDASHQEQSASEHDQSSHKGQSETVQESGAKQSSTTQSAAPVNTFSGTFNTGGGKIYQGNQFDSKGGTMNF